MDPFNQRQMVGPSVAFIDKLVLEVLDQRTILSFHVSLALGPVGYACSLFHSKFLASASQVVAVKLAAIVAGEQLRWTQGADEVLKSFNNPIGGFVTQLVASNVP